jgi:F-type H+-transporting ATPase subunit delta
MDPKEYGKALFLLAKEENITELIWEQAKAVKNLLLENPKYITLLDTPAVPTGEKQSLLQDAFSGLHTHLISFMKILISKRSVYLFPRVVAAYNEAYDEMNNIMHANAITAVPLTITQVGNLTAKLCKITGKNVILQNEIDPSIIGGVRLQFDGKQLDSSLETQLLTLRETIKQSNL